MIRRLFWSYFSVYQKLLFDCFLEMNICYVCLRLEHFTFGLYGLLCDVLYHILIVGLPHDISCHLSYILIEWKLKRVILHLYPVISVCCVFSLLVWYQCMIDILLLWFPGFNGELQNIMILPLSKISQAGKSPPRDIN